MELKLANLNKTYKNSVKALDEVSITISTGMFGLLGPNGAGKSTLMRVISTLQEPDTGTLYLDDLDILNQKMELRKKLGYLPQDFGVYPKSSAWDLLEHFASLKGIADKNERKKAVETVLQQTNLYDVRNKKVGTYSSGMRQRFGIAQALLANPELIIVDEPTAGLDPEERHRFLNILKEVGSDHIVILSTHIVEDVKELCTDMAIMNNGGIQSHKKPSEAIEEIKDKIWVKSISKEEEESFKQSHDVISTKFGEGNELIARVYNETALDNTFEKVKPNLDDVYFLTLKEGHKEAQY
ncbi:MAG: ABC transporter ATP-binding protein [Flavobacteriales bacterium]